MPQPAVGSYDLASGKFVRVFTSNAAAVTAMGAGNPQGALFGQGRLIPRGVVVKTGTLQVVTLDGVTNTLPDMVSPWQWNIQFRSILGGTAADIVVIY